MNVKIDTKEKFTVITPIESNIPANMTVEWVDLLLTYLNKPIPHIILNLKHVEFISHETAEKTADCQQQFYEKNISFVICELNKTPESTFAALELLDVMNVTPTESEAWDILQMEEIERELLRDNDEKGIGNAAL